MRHLTVGILAHVDAGKTTLSEAMLYCAGKLRRLGRVDHGNTYLDSAPMDGGGDRFCSAGHPRPRGFFR